MRRMTSGGRRALLLALLAGAGYACASGPPSREEVRSHMFNTMWRMGAIPSRLLMGDLEGVRHPARLTGEQIAAETMLGGEARRERMRALAAEVEGAATLPEAARSAALLAAECGACHAETDGGPRFGEMEGIPVGPRLSTHMLRHVWAADRLWEGLFAADPRHWSRGAQVLMEDPLPFFARLRETPEVGRHAERVHELGAEALATDDRADRARIYAELIATCADCHRAMGVPREGR